MQTFHKLQFSHLLEFAQERSVYIDLWKKNCWLCVCQFLSDDANFMLVLPNIVVLHVSGKVLHIVGKNLKLQYSECFSMYKHCFWIHPLLKTIIIKVMKMHYIDWVFAYCVNTAAAYMKQCLFVCSFFCFFFVLFLNLNHFK